MNLHLPGGRPAPTPPTKTSPPHGPLYKPPPREPALKPTPKGGKPHLPSPPAVKLPEKLPGQAEVARTITIDPKKLPHHYQHAPDFGVKGNWNKANGAAFQEALRRHVASAPSAIKGTFRGTIKVTHYFDPASNLWVAIDEAGNLVTSWKLSADQLANLLRIGNVQ